MKSREREQEPFFPPFGTKLDSQFAVHTRTRELLKGRGYLSLDFCA